jgi:hypothetical protein
MMRIGFAIVFALAACSSSGGAPTVTTVTQQQVLETPSAAYHLDARENRDVIVTTILAPSDSVWRLLPGVFLELGVDPGTVNADEMVIANTSFQLRRSLGGVRASRYLDCGGSIAGPMADQAAITMSLTVQVVRDSSVVSTLRTQMHAWAHPEGAVIERISCASTGALEARIARMVRDNLARRAKP